MNSISSSNVTKIKILVNIGVGLLLLAAGIFLRVTDSHLIQNPNAIIGLAIIPFGIALSLWLNQLFIKKYPKNMKPQLISENDERLKAIRNEADATTFLILRWALMLLYFGYTFVAPENIFETVSWWVLLVFFLLSYVLQGVLYKFFSDRCKDDGEDEGEAE